MAISNRIGFEQSNFDVTKAKPVRVIAFFVDRLDLAMSESKSA
jgi:hypothetical protein